jgi:hypothetical protein
MELKKPLHKNGTLISRRVNTHKGESVTACQKKGVKYKLKPPLKFLEKAALEDLTTRKGPEIHDNPLFFNGKGVNIAKGKQPYVSTVKKDTYKITPYISRRSKRSKGESMAANYGIKVVLKSNVSEIEVTPERVECEIKVFNPPPPWGWGYTYISLHPPIFCHFMKKFCVLMSWPVMAAFLPILAAEVMSC